MASQKRVLVQFGDHNRSGHVPSAYKSSKTEFELLIERVRDVCTIVLQVKDEEWGGAFVDYFEDTVPDKNIFRIVKGKKVAEDSYWFRKGRSRSRVYSDSDPGTSSTRPSWTRR